MIGKVVGSYTIQALIGEGGMGSVYKARSDKLGHFVAIKQMHPNLARDKAFVDRFLFEAKTMAKLNEHPNIVKVYDFIQENDLLLIIMEYIEGVSFQNLVEKRGPLQWKRAIELFVPLLDALNFAHYNGIIHRDLKPSNFILQNLHGTQIPKIMDFGIARDLKASKRMTATGVKMGALCYMSPEQAHGNRDITHTTDIYSMGVSFYEMLTGKLPFDSDSDFELMKAIISEPPPPIRQINPSIPAQIEAILNNAMAKNPTDRFSSSLQMKQALIQAATPKPQPPPKPPEQVNHQREKPQQAAPSPVQPESGPSKPEQPQSSLTPAHKLSSQVKILSGVLIVCLSIALAIALVFLLNKRDENGNGNGPPPPMVQVTHFKKIVASSKLKDTKTTYYTPWNLVDGRTDTCWAEGVGGAGIGESVTFFFQSSITLAKIEVFPGYNKIKNDRWGDRWYNNYRLRKARYTFSNGAVKYQTFRDEKSFQPIAFDPPISTNSVEITIMDAHSSGAKWDDTSIGEVRFYKRQ